MKVIIAGSRTWTNAEVLGETMRMFPYPIKGVLCGMAEGADRIGLVWAGRAEIPVAMFPADWKKHGKSAGPIRNAQMAQEADALVAFRCDGKSPGTDDMVRQAKARNLLVWVVNPKGEIQVFSSQGELFPK